MSYQQIERYIYISFNINNNLIFVDTFQFLSSSLDRVVKNLSKDDFKYFSQEFDKNVLDLVKQKGFYPCDYVSDFGQLKEKLLNKENFYSSLTGKILMIKNMNVFQMETMKDYRDLYFKCDVLIPVDMFEKFRSNSLKNYGLYESHYLNTPALS